MRKSIASEYFSLCIALIAASLICMSALLISFSFSTYLNDRRTVLSNVSNEVLSEYRAVLADGFDSGNVTEVENGLRSMSNWTNTLIILFDGSGDVLACSEASPCSHYGKKLNSDAIKSATSTGKYSMGTLNGYFDGARLNLLSSFEVREGQTMYLCITAPGDLLVEYLKRAILAFLLIFAVIMIVVYPLLKYTISRILSPVKEMTLAAKRFGEGDFSEKVNISDQNEMGYLANTLNDMASSLEAIEENRKSFISNVSHELRTPMTTIGGFVDGILDGTIPESQHKQYLRTVSEEINRLARLVRSMLNISKYEAGELELQTEVFDLTSLTIRTVLLFEKRIEAKHIDIRGLDAGRFFVNADEDLAQQVIYNLTENAVKFVDEGGYISYDFRKDDKFVYAVIRNSGEGLKKNEINKVFDRFYKTDESRGKDKTGVGLGLSIVRSIIKLHDGSILVRSKPGEYTEFEFSLPVCNPGSHRSEQ